jgi:hypothetical protein
VFEVVGFSSRKFPFSIRHSKEKVKHRGVLILTKKGCKDIGQGQPCFLFLRGIWEDFTFRAIKSEYLERRHL